MFPENTSDLTQIDQKLNAESTAEGTNMAFEIREEDLNPVELYFATASDENREILHDNIDNVVAKIYQDPGLIMGQDSTHSSLPFGIDRIASELSQPDMENNTPASENAYREWAKKQELPPYLPSSDNRVSAPLLFSLPSTTPSAMEVTEATDTHPTNSNIKNQC